MKAVVLCGGLGTRLGALTHNTPKPLVTVAGRPFLAHVLDKLCVSEIDGFVLATGYLSSQVSDTMGTAWQGRPVQYSVEPQALGTGGAVRLAMELIGADTVLVANGDTLFQCDIGSLLSGFDSSPWATRMALRAVDDCNRYGRVQLGVNGRVTTFGEKGHVGSGLINAGLYVQRRAPLERFGIKPFSLETDYLAKLAPQWPVQGVPSQGYFIDIGIPDDLASACRDLAGAAH